MEKMGLMGIMGLMLLAAGCAMPELKMTDRQYAGGKITRERAIDERGWQLLWAERAGRIDDMAYQVDKTTMGVVGGAAAGAVIGVVAGNPAAGAVIGTAAGGIGQAIATAKRGDATTSATTQR
ncbi:MAG: hypothetical protein ABFD89_01680 [Bryobacteraceae bacterium]